MITLERYAVLLKCEVPAYAAGIIDDVLVSDPNAGFLDDVTVFRKPAVAVIYVEDHNF